MILIILMELALILMLLFAIVNISEELDRWKRECSRAYTEISIIKNEEYRKAYREPHGTE